MRMKSPMRYLMAEPRRIWGALSLAAFLISIMNWGFRDMVWSDVQGDYGSMEEIWGILFGLLAAWLSIPLLPTKRLILRASYAVAGPALFLFAASHLGTQSFRVFKPLYCSVKTNSPFQCERCLPFKCGR
jgi:hypothetical protein